jgi:predicted DNA-binding protein with PD1-like motif
VLALIGDVVIDEGEPSVHAHVVVGKRDGTAHGGHLVAARVWPTLEVIVTESPGHLCKRYDPDSGLALISIQAGDSTREPPR